MDQGTSTTDRKVNFFVPIRVYKSLQRVELPQARFDARRSLLVCRQGSSPLYESMASNTLAPPDLPYPASTVLKSDYEFLQSLASPSYLHYLATSHPATLASAEFQLYLLYLHDTYSKTEYYRWGEGVRRVILGKLSQEASINVSLSNTLSFSQCCTPWRSHISPSLSIPPSPPSAMVTALCMTSPCPQAKASKHPSPGI